MAEPVGCVTQSQREPIRIKQRRIQLNFKSKKKPTPGGTEGGRQHENYNLHIPISHGRTLMDLYKLAEFSLSVFSTSIANTDGL